MITAEDREQALASAPFFVELAQRNTSALKVFLRALEALSGRHPRRDSQTEQLIRAMAESGSLLSVDEAVLRNIWVDFVEGVADTESVRLYSTREIARYFGVSVTTINHWIAENRFVGIQKSGPRKHASIPESALWRTSKGEGIPVYEIIQAYEEDAPRRHTTEDARKQHLEDLQRLETKYGGSFEATLGARQPQSLEEERDTWEWQYVLNVLRSQVERH